MHVRVSHDITFTRLHVAPLSLRVCLGRTTKGHSDLCRQRALDKLFDTPEGQRRIAAANERINLFSAKGIGQPDQAPRFHGRRSAL